MDLEPWIQRGVLVEEALQGPEDERLFIQFAAALFDGEAEASALAVARGYTLATDDRKARRVVTRRQSAVRLTGTLELLRDWQLTAQALDAEAADALRRIAERASYQPRRTDPLYDWWKQLIGE